MTTPKIKPINIKEYTVKQSKYETVGKLPLETLLWVHLVVVKRI